MNIDTILISEYASSDGFGRLTVVNAFNKLFGTGPTWGLPIMYLTMVAHGPRREAGREWDGEVRLLNAKRELVNKKSMPFKVTFADIAEDEGEQGMPLRAVVHMAFAGLQFPAPGAYAFEVYLDGTYAAATTLYVEQTEAKKG